MGKAKQHNANALGGFLQGFAQALQIALARRDRQQENEARRGERREDDQRYREQFEEQKRHNRETERQGDERIDKRGSVDSKNYRERYGSKEERIVARRVRSHLEQGIRDPQQMYEADTKETRRKMRVEDLPSALQATLFKGRKGEEEVEIGAKDIEGVRKRILEEGADVVFPNVANPKSIDEELASFKKKLQSFADREGLTPSSYQDVLDEEMQAFERDTQAKMGPEQPQPEGQMPVPAGVSPVSRDGKVIDHVSNLMAQRLSRDPKIAMAAGHELRKLGYPTPVSPFDAFDPMTGEPSPDLVRAAMQDPELAGMLEARAQQQQAMQGPAQTQTSGPGGGKPQRQMGRTAEVPRVQPQSQPASRPGMPMAPKRRPFTPPPPVTARQ